LSALSRDSAGRIAVERVSAVEAVAWQPPGRAPSDLTAAAFSRRLDLSWRRTSYTALTSAAHDRGPGGVRSEPEEPELEDEAPAPASLPSDAGAVAAAAADEEALFGVLSPMGDLPSGTGFGIVVHSVLESVDTSAPDLGAELLACSHEVLSRRLGTALEAETLGAALLPAMETPLGPLAGGVRLRDVMPADRLAELDFELPLAGGDEPTRRDATLATLAEMLRPRLPAGDPLVGYADALDVPMLSRQRLRGYLSGSIDAVLRVRDATGSARYLVVDYKTNWLGGFGPDGAEPLTAWHYRPAALAAEMIRAHYPLQALLYAVALHRFVRWREPDYDPARHLGGVLYLYLRGMCGPATPEVDGQPCGVFSWLPPPGLVQAVSTLLAQGAP
jgi:exodeoxyribonuclease V beta subunit